MRVTTTANLTFLLRGGLSAVRDRAVPPPIRYIFSRAALPLLLGAVAFVFSCFGIDNNDTWWHLASARHIFEAGRFPTSDPFSHLLDGAPWIDEYWLFQAVIYGIWALGGEPLLVVAKAAWIAAIFVVAGAILVRRSSTTWEIVGVAALPALVVLADRLTIRPELATWAALAAFLLILPRGTELPARRARIALPLIQVAWTNAHPGFLLGPVVVALVAGGQALNLLRSDERHRFSPLARRYAALLGLVCAATLLTPYGWRLLALPFSVTESATYRALINEWNPPSAGRLWAQRHVVALFGVPLVAGLFVRGRRADAVHWILAIAFGFLATRALRHNTVWSLVSFILLAEVWGPSTIGFVERRRRWGAPIKLAAAGALFSALILAATGWSWRLLGSYRRPALRHFEWRVSEDSADFLVHNKELLSGNLFNDYNIGGSLLWGLEGSRKIHIDGRLVPYGERHLRETMDVINGRAPWRAYFEAHGIDIAVLSNEAEPLIAELAIAEDWKLVHLGGRTLIFARDQPDHAQLIDDWGIEPDDLDPYASNVRLLERGSRLLPPPTPYPANSRARILLILGRPDLAARVAGAQLDLMPDYAALRELLPTLLIEAGRRHLARKEWSEGEQVLSHLIEIEPRNFNAWNNLGVLFARSGQTEKAREAWREALRLSPGNRAISENLRRLDGGESN